MTWNRKTSRRDRKRKSRSGRRFLAKVKRDQNQAFGFRRREAWHIPFADIRWGGCDIYRMDEQVPFIIGPFVSIANPRSMGVISGYSLGGSLPVDTPPPDVP